MNKLIENKILKYLMEKFFLIIEKYMNTFLYAKPRKMSDNYAKE